MTRVLTVIGTRPEAIKMGPVLMALARDPRFESRVAVSGQHREMVEPMLDLFGIRPDYTLRNGVANRTLTRSMSDILDGVEPILEEENPDWVLVEGDTTTVMAAALAAFFEHHKVAHVEAGLRTPDVHTPFPEELDRRVTSLTADLHFAPTEGAAANLRGEGVPDEQVLVTGNPVVDASHYVRNSGFDPAGTPLGLVPLDKRLILATAHRRENHGDPLHDIALGLRELALRHEDVQIVFPIHLNPAVGRTVEPILRDVPNVSLLPPLDYQALIWLLERVYFVITDSGGLQEEASAFSKPVLVLRDVTERAEGVESGVAKLIGTDSDAIVREGGLLLDDDFAYAEMIAARCPYGDGHAAERIVAALAGEQEPKRQSRLGDAWDTLGAQIESSIAEVGELGDRLVTGAQQLGTQFDPSTVTRAWKLGARLTRGG